MHKKIIYLLMTLILTSCSSIKIGYSFGDWLIKREILKSVKLYKDQQEKLELILDDYMAWHKKEMLPKYLQSIKSIKKSIEKKSVHEELDQIQKVLIKNFFQTLTRLGQDIAPVISSINGVQLDRSRVLIAKSFDKKIKKNKSYTSEDVYSLWKDSSEDWFGELNPKQELWLKSNMSKLYVRKDAQVKLAIAGQRQKTFLEIFDEKDPAKRTVMQIDFWKNLEAKYRFFEGRPHMVLLLKDYLSLIDEGQKTNIIQKLTEIESQIKMLME